MRKPNGQLALSADPRRIAALVAQKTGQKIAWDANSRCFTTRDGDVYPPGDIEDAARQMIDWPDYVGEMPEIPADE